MEKIRKASREAAAKKVKALTSADPHTKVDSSTWTPPEMENAGVKTGMRPVSKRQFKRGGKVCGDVEGKMAKVRADRKARKSGGKAGEQPPVDRHINRDLKKANDYRDGTKHVGGMKKGGRIHKDDGGSTDDIAKLIRADEIARGQMGRGLPPRPVPLPPRRPTAPSNFIPATNLTTQGAKRGGRAKKDIGGGTPYDVSMPGMPEGRGKGILRSEAGLKRGGAAKEKQIGGGLAAAAPRGVTPAQALMLRKRLMSGMPTGAALTGMAPQTGLMRKSGGKAEHPDVAADKALIKKMVKPEARTGKKDGGGKWIQGAIKHPGALHKQLGVPAGEKIPAKKLAAAAEKGGKLGKRARLAQTLRGMHAAGGSVFEGDSKSKVPGVVGGRQARKAGGRAKGKTNINIVVSPGGVGGAPQPPMPPMIPGQAGTPPMPPRPPMMPPQGMPPMMPPMGGAPMAGAPPMGMPPAGMPPMARKAGGRVYRSFEDMDAGAGGGEGRLEKTEIQTHKR